jgi:predicted phage-related endonuclease
MPTARPVPANHSEPTTDVVALDTLAEELRLLRQITAQLAALGKLQTTIQRKIKSALGNAETGTFAGQPVVTWKRTLRVGVSQKLLKQRYPRIVADVLDITEVRTFKVLDR